MKKIGIINCYNISKRCCSIGCFKAFHNREGSFEKYKNMDAEIYSYTHCNGCGDDSVKNVLQKAKMMNKLGVDVIHLSTCIKTKCPHYQEFLTELSKHYTVEEFTH